MSREKTSERLTFAPSSSFPENGPALIFLHIPKTAGTTLNRIIDWQYSPFATFTMDPYRIRATPQRFSQLSEERRRKLRVVRGHMPFGIHKYLPQGATYITLLREPVARVLSAYYFVLRRPLNPLHRKLKKQNLRVEDCLRLFPERNNLQCKFIAGNDNAEIDDARLLDLAKQNLTNSFSVVGISEKFGESLALISTTFDWEIPFYQNQKVAKIRPLIDQKLADLIKEYNPLDVELYEFGKKIFEEHLHEREEAIKKYQSILRETAKPGMLNRFGRSTVGRARFLLSKFASAI